MIISDNGYEYDTDYLEAAIAAGDKKDSIQRDVLNMFARYAYYRYNQIRDLTKQKKCRHMTIEQVREKVNVEYVSDRLGIQLDEVHYFIDFVDQHMEIK